MASLIDKLFPESQVNAIKDLWKDKSSQLLLRQEIGKALINYEDILIDLPLSQLMFITSLSNFANSDTECHDVAAIIYWGINRNDILPYVTEQQECKELAYKCLISLGMFKAVLVKRWERSGAPSPNFYRGVGIKSFEIIGMNDISCHFYQWENFISEFFI
jgi:hypothetical protein